MLEGLERGLGKFPEQFHWTRRQAGFFTVFTFRNSAVRTDDEFINNMVAEYGLVVIPMYDFYPRDARARRADVGYDQLRLSFCFSESVGEQRRKDLQESVAAYCVAAKAVAGV